MTQQRSFGWLLTVTIILVWLGGLTAAYFVTHKPFDLNNIVALLRSGLAVAVWLLISLIGAGLGRKLLPWLQAVPRLDRLVLTTGLGLGMLGLMVIGLGLAGLLWRPLFWALALLALFLLRTPIRASLRDFKQLRQHQPQETFSQGLRLYIILNLILTFLLALLPETAWDSLVYHLTGPKLYAQWGRIAHPIDLAYLGFPQQVEMLYLAAILLLSHSAAPLIHFGYGLLALGITAALARRLFNEATAWLAAAILVSAETILLEMTWSYVDLALLFYSTAALYAFLAWRDTPQRHWLLLSAALAGLAMAAKYTAVFAPLSLGLALVWHNRRAGWQTLLRSTAMFAGVALVMLLPGLLENWLTTGNPVYPFALPGLFWDSWRGWWYSRPGTGLAFSEPWRLAIAPLDATLFGFEGGGDYTFHLGPFTLTGVSYSATLGPLFLMGAPLWLFLWRFATPPERSGLKHILWFCGVGYLLWLAGVAQSALLIQSRLLLPIFGGLAVLSASGLLGLKALHRASFDIGWVAKMVVGLVLALSLVNTTLRFGQSNPLPYLFGYQSTANYYQRTLGSHADMVTQLNTTLPTDAHILFLWEPRSFLCQTDCRPDGLLDRFLHLTQQYPDISVEAAATAIANTWRNDGVTHVLLYQQGLDAIVAAKFDPVTARDLAILAKLQALELTEIYRLGDAYVLYEVK